MRYIRSFAVVLTGLLSPDLAAQERVPTSDAKQEWPRWHPFVNILGDPAGSLVRPQVAVDARNLVHIVGQTGSALKYHNTDWRSRTETSYEVSQVKAIFEDPRGRSTNLLFVLTPGAAH